MYCQLDQLLTKTARRLPNKIAIDDNKQQLSYLQLDQQVSRVAHWLSSLSLVAGSRIAIYLPKQVEAVVMKFAASRAGLVFVPINSLLKAAQVSYILDNCQVKLLLTSGSRANQLDEIYHENPHLKDILLVDEKRFEQNDHHQSLETHIWDEVTAEANEPITDTLPRPISRDLAAILYTSGSTGNPKGVCLSHGNLIAGAESVAQYLENNSDDKLLAVLPLSFDYGLSQVTTAILSGATVVLMEYLLPRDVIRQVEKHGITGLAAVPPLWVQLADLEWPEATQKTLRYITNSGGAMPTTILGKLRKALPTTQPFLMYGLTEAFRSTFLDPKELDRRPESIGKAIPNAEILVLNENGEECKAGEIGELVHRGAHVSLGYWNAPEKTATRFKPFRAQNNYLSELAVWSGDRVKKDDDGFLYFIGRSDDMIKSSGYRISPSELEDEILKLDDLVEVSALGVPDPQLGQAILLVVVVKNELNEKRIKQYCAKQLPNFMQPKYIEFVEKLPRNPNGKIDRKNLLQQYQSIINS